MFKKIQKRTGNQRVRDDHHEQVELDVTQSTGSLAFESRELDAQQTLIKSFSAPQEVTKGDDDLEMTDSALPKTSKKPIISKFAARRQRHGGLVHQGSFN
jgi:hypothetical protein